MSNNVNSSKKPLVYCGVIDLMTNEPVKMTDEQKEKFTKMCSNSGEYNAVFCEDDSIPKTMELIANINKK